MTSTAEYLANPVRRNVTTCRRCGDLLTNDNARRYSGRWVGACRKCENAENRDRVTKHGNRRAAKALDVLVDLSADESTMPAAVRRHLEPVCDWLEQLAGDWA